MYKRRRRAMQKQRATRRKLWERRRMARQFLMGQVSLDQLREMAGEAFRGVLKVAGYLVEEEGVRPASQARLQELRYAMEQNAVPVPPSLLTVAPARPRPPREARPRRRARTEETAPTGEST